MDDEAPRTHHTPARTPTREDILADIDELRVEISARIDEYIAHTLNTWLMPRVHAAQAGLDAPTGRNTMPTTTGAPLSEAAPDGFAWLIPGETDRYHVLQCVRVQGAATDSHVIEVEVAGPETLAGRVMCHACARRLGHDAWPATTPATASEGAR